MLPPQATARTKRATWKSSEWAASTAPSTTRATRARPSSGSARAAPRVSLTPREQRNIHTTHTQTTCVHYLASSIAPPRDAGRSRPLHLRRSFTKSWKPRRRTRSSTALVHTSHAHTHTPPAPTNRKEVLVCSAPRPTPHPASPAFVCAAPLVSPQAAKSVTTTAHVCPTGTTAPPRARSPSRRRSTPSTAPPTATPHPAPRKTSGSSSRGAAQVTKAAVFPCARAPNRFGLLALPLHQ